MSRLIRCAVATAAVLVVVPTASASATNQFSGACQIAGTATFTKPLTNTPSTNGYKFSGKGTCNGVLDGAPIRNAAVSAVVSNASATLSCAASVSTNGPGSLTFPGSKIIKFTLTEFGVGPNVALVIRGASQGGSTGAASFLTSIGPNTITACAGAGLKTLGFTAAVASPLIAG